MASLIGRKPSPEKIVSIVIETGKIIQNIGNQIQRINGDQSNLAIASSKKSSSQSETKSINKNETIDISKKYDLNTDIINQLMKRIWDLETQQNTRFRTGTSYGLRCKSISPERKEKRCHYCKKSGHLIAECRKRQWANSKKPNREEPQYGANYSYRRPIEINSRPIFSPNPEFCMRCGKHGHNPRNCYDAICAKCKQICHLSDQCRRHSIRKFEQQRP